MRPGGASISPGPSGSCVGIAPSQTRRGPGRGGRGSQPCRCRRSCSLPVSIPWHRRQSGSRLAWSRKLPPSTSGILWWTSVAGRPQRQLGWRKSARRRARFHAAELQGSRLYRVTLEAYEYAFRVIRPRRRSVRWLWHAGRCTAGTGSSTALWATSTGSLRPVTARAVPSRRVPHLQGFPSLRPVSRAGPYRPVLTRSFANR
jgi:hypothetical protein